MTDNVLIEFTREGLESFLSLLNTNTLTQEVESSTGGKSRVRLHDWTLFESKYGGPAVLQVKSSTISQPPPPPRRKIELGL